jgi:hypothetical protein
MTLKDTHLLIFQMLFYSKFECVVVIIDFMLFRSAFQSLIALQKTDEESTH